MEGSHARSVSLRESFGQWNVGGGAGVVVMSCFDGGLTVVGCMVLVVVEMVPRLVFVSL